MAFEVFLNIFGNIQDAKDKLEQTRQSLVKFSEDQIANADKTAKAVSTQTKVIAELDKDELHNKDALLEKTIALQKAELALADARKAAANRPNTIPEQTARIAEAEANIEKNRKAKKSTADDRQILQNATGILNKEVIARDSDTRTIADLEKVVALRKRDIQEIQIEVGELTVKNRAQARGAASEIENLRFIEAEERRLIATRARAAQQQLIQQKNAIANQQRQRQAALSGFGFGLGTTLPGGIGAIASPILSGAFGGGLGAISAGAGVAVGGLISGVGSLLSGFVHLTEEAVKFRNELDQSAIAIAGVLSETSNFTRAGQLIVDPIEKFDAALEVAKRVQGELLALTLRTNITVEEGNKALEVGLGFLSARNVKAEDAAKILIDLSALAKVIGLVGTRASRDIAGIVSGVASGANRLGQALRSIGIDTTQFGKLTGDELKKYAAAHLSFIEEAIKRSSTLTKVSFENIKDAVNIILANAVEPAEKRFSSLFTNILNKFVDSSDGFTKEGKKIQDAFEGAFNFIADLLEKTLTPENVAKTVSILGEILKVLTDIGHISIGLLGFDNLSSFLTGVDNLLTRIRGNLAYLNFKPGGRSVFSPDTKAETTAQQFGVQWERSRGARDRVRDATKAGFTEEEATAIGQKFLDTLDTKLAEGSKIANSKLFFNKSAFAESALAAASGEAAVFELGLRSVEKTIEDVKKQAEQDFGSLRPITITQTDIKSGNIKKLQEAFTALKAKENPALSPSEDRATKANVAAREAEESLKKQTTDVILLTAAHKKFEQTQRDLDAAQDAAGRKRKIEVGTAKDDADKLLQVEKALTSALGRKEQIAKSREGLNTAKERQHLLDLEFDITREQLVNLGKKKDAEEAINTAVKSRAQKTFFDAQVAFIDSVNKIKTAESGAAALNKEGTILKFKGEFPAAELKFNEANKLVEEARANAARERNALEQRQLELAKLLPDILQKSSEEEQKLRDEIVQTNAKIAVRIQSVIGLRGPQQEAAKLREEAATTAAEFDKQSLALNKVRDLYNDVVKSADTLNTDSEFQAALQQKVVEANKEAVKLGLQPKDLSTESTLLSINQSKKAAEEGLAVLDKITSVREEQVRQLQNIIQLQLRLNEYLIEEQKINDNIAQHNALINQVHEEERVGILNVLEAYQQERKIQAELLQDAYDKQNNTVEQIAALGRELDANSAIHESMVAQNKLRAELNQDAKYTKEQLLDQENINTAILEKQKELNTVLIGERTNVEVLTRTLTDGLKRAENAAKNVGAALTAVGTPNTLEFGTIFDNLSKLLGLYRQVKGQGNIFKELFNEIKSGGKIKIDLRTPEQKQAAEEKKADVERQTTLISTVNDQIAATQGNTKALDSNTAQLRQGPPSGDKAKSAGQFGKSGLDNLPLGNGPDLSQDPFGQRVPADTTVNVNANTQDQQQVPQEGGFGKTNRILDGVGLAAGGAQQISQGGVKNAVNGAVDIVAGAIAAFGGPIGVLIAGVIEAVKAIVNAVVSIIDNILSASAKRTDKNIQDTIKGISDAQANGSQTLAQSINDYQLLLTRAFEEAKKHGGSKLAADELDKITHALEELKKKQHEIIENFDFKAGLLALGKGYDTFANSVHDALTQIKEFLGAGGSIQTAQQFLSNTIGQLSVQLTGDLRNAQVDALNLAADLLDQERQRGDLIRNNEASIRNILSSGLAEKELTNGQIKAQQLYQQGVAFKRQLLDVNDKIASDKALLAIDKSFLPVGVDLNNIEAIRAALLKNQIASRQDEVKILLQEANILAGIKKNADGTFTLSPELIKLLGSVGLFGDKGNAQTAKQASDAFIAALAANPAAADVARKALNAKNFGDIKFIDAAQMQLIITELSKSSHGAPEIAILLPILEALTSSTNGLQDILTVLGLGGGTATSSVGAPDLTGNPVAPVISSFNPNPGITTTGPGGNVFGGPPTGTGGGGIGTPPPHKNNPLDAVFTSSVDVTKGFVTLTASVAPLTRAFIGISNFGPKLFDPILRFNPKPGPQPFDPRLLDPIIGFHPGSDILHVLEPVIKTIKNINNPVALPLFPPEIAKALIGVTKVVNNINKPAGDIYHLTINGSPQGTGLPINLEKQVADVIQAIFLHKKGRTGSVEPQF